MKGSRCRGGYPTWSFNIIVEGTGYFMTWLIVPLVNCVFWCRLEFPRHADVRTPRRGQCKQRGQASEASGRGGGGRGEQQ